jgi:hypothetical protein
MLITTWIKRKPQPPCSFLTPKPLFFKPETANNDLIMRNACILNEATMEWNSFPSINFCASKPRGEYLDSLLGHKTGIKPKGFLAIPHLLFWLENMGGY